MRVTKISVNLAAEGNLVAYVNVVFDDVFIIRGIRVVVKPDGSRLMLMPSRQNRVGEFKDVCHPLTRDFRTRLESLVIGKLDELSNQNPECQTRAS